MNPMSKDEILKAVNKLKYNGKGSKTISTMVLKDNTNGLSEILTHVGWGVDIPYRLVVRTLAIISYICIIAIHLLGYSHMKQVRTVEVK